MIKKILDWRPQKLHDDQTGLILITIVIVISALMVVGFALISSATSQYLLTRNDSFTANALQTAEAGIEQSMQQLNGNDSFAGYSTPQQFFDNETQGLGTFTVTIADSPTASNAKIITSIGKVYRHNDTSTPVSTKIVRVTAVGTQSEGYSVYSGPGGLTVEGSGGITNSDVYVNGTITLKGTSKIGTASQPVNVDAANYACSTPSYPSLCTSSQPIAMDYSTNIYGTVCATGQTSTGPHNNIQGGSTGQGLKPNCTAPQVSMPTYDRNAQIAAVTTTGSGSDNAYTCNNWPFDRTWPANLELTGNVSIASSCNLTIKGNVYITGNLDIGGAAKITVDNGAGTTRPVVIVDGTITVGGSAQMITNSSGTGIEFISFCSKTSSKSNCTSPSTLTGSALQTSSTLPTVTVGGAVKVPGMVFNAYWGELILGGSGNIGSGIGQSIDVNGSGSITFGTKLSSGSRTWTISSYQELYPNQL